MNDIIIPFLVGCLVTTVIGALIGTLRGRPGDGGILGLLLGPIGWIIVLFLEDKRPGSPASQDKALKAALYQQRLDASDPVEQWEREQKRAGRSGSV